MITSILVAAVFLGLATALASVNWAPDHSIESLKPRWAPAPSKFLVIENVSVHLRDEGPTDDPHPIVLLHGTSSSLHTWEGWVAILRRNHRVISLDIPGFGLTGPFPLDDYRIEHYTRFMGAVLDRLGVKHAVLAGNSLGGYIAWQTALARPDLVERLVLIDARGYPIDEKTLPLAWRIARIPVLRSLMNRIPPRAFVEKAVLRVYGDRRKVTAALVDRYYEMTMRAGNRRALTVMFQQQSFDDWSRIKEIAVPTLILWGRLDCQAPLSDAERFHKDIAGSRLVIFDKLGHVPQEEDPVESIMPLEVFLDDLIEGGAGQASLRQAAAG